MKITFSPHIRGMGHRVRCSLIAGKVNAIRPGIMIKFMLRRDDPVPPDKWLAFDYVKGRWGRSFNLITSACLVEDGAWFDDFRVKFLKKKGGRIVAISMPHGFSPDITYVERCLKLTDLVIVPWPKKLFSWPDELSEFKDRVKRVEPIFLEPKMNEQGKDVKGREGHNIYVSISAETEKIFPIIEKAVERLKPRFPHLELTATKSYEEVRSAAQHMKIMKSSDLVIAMGMATTFESCFVGVPRICIALPSSGEQMQMGKMLTEEGAAYSIPLPELNAGKMAESISTIFDDPKVRDEMIVKGKEMVPKSGLDDAARLILDILGKAK
ncbi:MAG: hypothetical protein JSW28_03545 [Thermoplasmata archaeon]|nr:MAG: hypothetical protein JSW28_03545 [Thermoplasmata archaeon]